MAYLMEFAKSFKRFCQRKKKKKLNKEGAEKLFFGGINVSWKTNFLFIYNVEFKSSGVEWSC